MDEERYNFIRARLTIDPMRLTEDLIELPQHQQEASEGAADAQRLSDEAKDILDQTKAQTADSIRNDPDLKKQPSEAQITSEILLDDNVRDALATLRETEYELALWKSLADGMRAKSTAITTISRLIEAGYTSPTAIYQQRRAQINEKRQARVGGPNSRGPLGLD
jgi:hypothetical protein